jgi:hypothetical protein
MFAPFAPWIVRLPAKRFPTSEELTALLVPGTVSGGGARLAFVPPSEDDVPYEVDVHRSGRVRTRADNWHDLFNALVWMAFPRTKAVMNARHVREIERLGTSGPRGTARDVLSLFDEGGVIVAGTDASLLALLQGFEWKALFWERRAEVLQKMRFFVFGHALLEKALEPYKAVTAKALLLEVPSDFLDRPAPAQVEEADRLAAQWFARDEALVSTRTLAPLPVLGVPGWAENDSAGFYDDPAVFRPGYGKAGTVGSRPWSAASG